MLAGDIGGTNARLAIYAASTANLSAGHVSTEVYTRKYKVRNFNSLAAVLAQFLKDAEKDRAISLNEYLQIKSRSYPTTACFAVAGPVANNEVDFTNIDNWPVTRGADLQRQLGIQKVQLINDFSALSEGVVAMEEHGMCKFMDIQKGRDGWMNEKRHKYAPKLVIGAGTGLGECLLIWNGKYYQACPSEGGHVDFGPRNEEQSHILDYLRNKYNSSQGGSPHVSVERLCSGKGIEEIYRYLRHRYPENVHRESDAEFDRAVEKAVVVTEHGKKCLLSASSRGIGILGAKLFSSNGGDVGSSSRKNESLLMQQALELFVAIYGAEVGNAALKFLPFGGIYIGGGIAANLKEYLQLSPTFLSCIRDKGKMGQIVRKMPIKLILSDGVAIRGAETVARRKLQAFLDDI